MTYERHLVFLYGTLKTGEPNHHVLNNPDTGVHELIGIGHTIEKFTLVIATQFNIPFLLNEPGKGHQITGEIYSVDEKKLAELDRLEDYPNLYKREKHSIKMINDEVLHAWIYLLPIWSEEIVQTASAPLQIYNSNGPHGRVLEKTKILEIMERENLNLFQLIKGTQEI
uniref:Gamma-glutamylcyclotransferase family protein n=1 Tax=Acrobeloides nanus TaxID=290746 RepID=A0A914EPQ5_9BILA